MISNEEAVKLLGKQVKVTLNHGDGQHPTRIAVGKLLAFDTDGACEVHEEDGLVHFCWPMLDIEEVAPSVA
jgi:hypothetical protein